MPDENYFRTLNSVNVNENKEKKNGLDYLSWAWAWAEIKKRYPDTTFKVYENEHGNNYFSDGKTGWVKVGVTCNGIEHIEYLPIMNTSNRSIPADNITSFDVNKAIQRARTKAIADHGLGLYIYAGEDLPDEGGDETEPQQHVCEECGKPITAHGNYSAETIATGSKRAYGKQLCFDCSSKHKQQAQGDK